MFCSQALAGIFFVSTEGSDGNDGSLSSPWRTVIHAWRNSGGGDTVYVRGGTYIESQMWLRGGGGSNNQFWTLKAYPGETPIFTNARLLPDDDYIRIQGLHLTGSSYAKVVSYSEGIHEHIEILDNVFTGASPALYYICNNGLVQGNTVNLTNAGSHGLYIMHGSNNIIRNNYVRGALKYGIHIYDEEKYPSEGSVSIKNLLVENNTVVGSVRSSGFIISGGDGSKPPIDIDGVVIRNNVTINNAANGIRIAFQGHIRNVDIFNNVIYGNERSGISITASDVDDITIKNNIFSSNKRAQIEISSSLNNLVVSHNLYYQPESDGNGVTDVNPVFGNPLFVNVDEADFHLQENSPAIDAGTDVGLPYTGAAQDIGAFEYSPTVSVELSTFEASVKGNTVRLNWQTTSETNNFGFEVERSSREGVCNKIGFVKGQGTTTSAKVYGFVDENLETGRYYYRLKQIDLDGSFRYFRQIEVVVKVPDQFNLQQNYPNPFNPKTKIKFSLQSNAFVDLSIINSLGQRIATLIRGYQSLGWKTVNWEGVDDNGMRIPSGIYFYCLTSKQYSSTRKMVLLQ